MSAFEKFWEQVIEEFNKRARAQGWIGNELDGARLFGVIPVSAVPVHKTTHQDGGSDEISLAGLSGEAATPQPPKAHEIVDHLATGGSEGDVPTVQADGSLALQAPAGGSVDAADVTYTPAVPTDWAGDADPGDVDEALDQLAERVEDLEGASGGHTIQNEGVSLTQRAILDFQGAGVTASDSGGKTVVTIPGGSIVNKAIRDRIGTASHTTKLARQEGVAFNAGATLTLADLAGSGTVLGIWLTLRGASLFRDTLLRVYVDGEVTPSIEFDVGSLGTHFVNSGTVKESTQHVSVEIDFALAHATYVLTFPIPFGTRCRIDAYNPTATSDTLWSQVYYTNDLTDTRRLKSANVRWTPDKDTVAAGGSYSFLDVSASGCLVWHSLICDAPTNAHFMESDVRVFVDGEGSPSISATGTEDWFLSGFYYMSGPQSSPWQFLTQRATTGPYRMSAGLDLLALCGGIKFSTRLILDWDCSESDTAVDISYIALYYVGQPSESDMPVDGSGTAGKVAYWADANTLAASVADEADLRDATKLQGRDLASTAPTDGQAIVWNDAAGQWEPGDVAPTITTRWEPVCDTAGSVLVDVNGNPVMAQVAVEV